MDIYNIYDGLKSKVYNNFTLLVLSNMLVYL